MKKIIYSLFFLSLLLTACRDDVYEETPLPNNPDTGFLLEGNVAGLVVDLSGNPVEGAQISLGSTNLTSDENGYFKYKEAEVSENGSLVKIQKTGYHDGYQFVYNTTGDQAYLKVTLVEQVEAGRFQGAAGGEVPVGQAKIVFPAAAVALSGNPYTGEVVVSAHWYDPATEQTLRTMPGDLRGVDASGAATQLATLGMMAVELSTTSGAKLDLREGALATLHFPLTEEMVNMAPTEAPLWSLDENTGVWKEEGLATLVNDEMVGQVSHFSFWNCDYAFPLVEIEGRLEDTNGDPIPNYRVSIYWTNTFVGGYGYTNTDGVFKGKVPQGVPLSLRVHHCGVELLNEDLGILTNDGSIGTFVTDLTDFSRSIELTLHDCFDNPLTDGYVITRSGWSPELLIPDADGKVTGQIAGCGQPEIFMKGYDPIRIAESADIPVAISNDPLNYGILKICGQLTEYIQYSIDGGLLNQQSEAEVFLVNNSFLHVYSFDLVSRQKYSFFADIISEGSVLPNKVEIVGFDEDSNLQYATCDNGQQITACDTELTISAFGNVGEWIVGELGGEISDGRDSIDPAGVPGTTVQLESSFQLFLDRVFDTGSFSGTIWHDENMDGIRDAGESPISGINIGLTNSLNQNPDIYGTNYVTSDEDGQYSFEGLIPGEEYIVRVFPINLYTASPQDQGNDDTVDSDFSSVTSGNSFVTMPIVLTNGQALSNIDLGLGITQLNCFGGSSSCPPNAEINVATQGGVPPYTASVNGQGLSSASGQFVFQNIVAGTYTVSFEDQTGLTCQYEVYVPEFRNTIQGVCWEDDPANTPDINDFQDPKYTDAEVSLVLEDGTIQEVTTTANLGRFGFKEVPHGSYRLKVDLPSDFEFVQMTVGNNIYADSDIDPLTGFSDVFEFSDCSDFLSLDIGVRRK